MKNNISSGTNCLAVDSVWFDLMETKNKREHRIDPCGAPKKTKQNKTGRCNRYTHFMSFSADVANVLI